MVKKLSVSNLSGSYSKTDYVDFAEQELLNIFSNKNSQKLVEEVLADNPSWPLEYHLSPDRENIINWYDFPKNSTLLEVGAGCGALTGLFSNKVSRVTALELTEIRSEVISKRYKNRRNIEVISGNIQDYQTKEKFDFVTCIGVLEYAGRYVSGENPYFNLLQQIKNHIKPNGFLILAIENKLGLKYWAGVREDHTGELFDSIQNYPKDVGLRTFGRVELEKLLKSVGFKKQEWFYPLPDYKLPIEIFSDSYLPNEKGFFSMGLFPSAARNTSREYIFSERLVMESLVLNGLFKDFANSFLVLAQNQ